MDNFRKKPSIVDEIRKQRILHVNDRKTLEYAVKILNRFVRWTPEADMIYPPRFLNISSSHREL